MTLQQTVAESLEQLKAWIAFLEDERRRLQDEIRRIRENPEPEAHEAQEELPEWLRLEQKGTASEPPDAIAGTDIEDDWL